MLQNTNSDQKCMEFIPEMQEQEQTSCSLVVKYVKKCINNPVVPLNESLGRPEEFSTIKKVQIS